MPTSDRLPLDGAWKATKRWLYIIHRWLGIVTCLFCAVWFVSGVVMMYVPYPSLTRAEKLARLEPVNWQAIHVAPDQALTLAGVKGWPTELRLETVLGRPVYRILAGGKRITVSAETGKPLPPADAAAALRIAALAVPGSRPALAATLENDQWTVAQGFNAYRPLHRIRLNPAGDELYVASTTSEVVQETTAPERFWNWIGSVPHWIYPTVLRQFPVTWRQVVLWTSGPALVGALAGIWVGILRLRVKRRFSGGRLTPYHGWMLWHHWAGLIGGILLTTWIFSGWLSVNPMQWFDRIPPSEAALDRYGAASRDTFKPDLARLARPGIREVRFLWVGGESIATLSGADGAFQVLDTATGAPANFSDTHLFALAARLMPDAKPAFTTRLTEEDSYWYSHHNIRQIPVLRVGFDDPNRTWFHIDPVTAQVIGRIDASGRGYRWLFNALHDFDLKLLLNHRPAWDIFMWLFSIIGTVTSVSAVVIGWRRLRHKLA